MVFLPSPLVQEKRSTVTLCGLFPGVDDKVIMIVTSLSNTFNKQYVIIFSLRLCFSLIILRFGAFYIVSLLQNCVFSSRPGDEIDLSQER